MSDTKNIFGEETKYARYLAYFLVLYSLTLIFLNILRIWGFGYGLQDIGIYHQVIWNTSQGRWFETSATFPYNEHTNWLGFHFDVLPILFSAAIYKLFPYIETLSVIHVLLVSLTSIIIFKICRKLETSPGIAFFWSMVYLLHQTTVFHALFSFQETSFSVALLTLGYYFVICRRFYWLLLICLLLVMTKEHHGITVFGFGLLWLFYNKNKIQAGILCLLGVVSAYLVMFVIIPQFTPYNEHFMLTNKFQDGGYNRYFWLKLPQNELFDKALEVIFNPSGRMFITLLVISFTFIPLVAFWFLFPVVSDFLVILLADSDVPRCINFYYSAPFIPACIIATAYVLKKLSAKHPILTRAFKAWILIALIGLFGHPFYLVATKLTFVLENNIDWSIGEKYQEVVSKIPVDKLLMTDHQSGSIISNRKRITLYNKYELHKADYVLLRITPFDFSPSSKMQNSYGVTFATDMVKAPGWEIIYWKYPFVLFAKGMPRGADVDTADFVDAVKRQIENYNYLYSGKDKKKPK